MHKAALYLEKHSQIHDNIVLFPPQYSQKTHRLAEAKISIKQQPHVFILLLGLMIGSVFALFIAYHIPANAMSYGLLFFIPMLLAYLLRRVYIHTLIQNLED